MTTLQEKIEVMQAFADGEAIEGCNPGWSVEWVRCPHPTWDWVACEYRIAPKTLSPEEARRAEIVAAYEAGAEIECCERYERVPSWAVVREPAWCWKYYNYRVKEPEPALVTFYATDGATLVFIRGSARHKRYTKMSGWTELT